MATIIFTPDAHPESTSVDGWVREFDLDGLTWAEIRGGSGYDANDDSFRLTANIQADAAANKWQQLVRTIMLFNTSSLPDDEPIVSVTLTLTGRSGADNLGISPSMNIYSSNPASIGAIVAGDFDSLGTTPFATAIAHSSWNQEGENIFTLNADGIAAISKTGITKLGARLVCDAEDEEPSWSEGQKQSSFNFYSADETSGGVSYPPKLTVTYGTSPIVTTQAVDNIHILYARGNGNITSVGSDAVTKRGICWKETSGPTIADNIAEDTSSSFSTGAFVNWITPILPEATYYVKAYAYNIIGYGYGDEVTFTAYAQDGGYIWIETEKFHFIDESGTEQDLENFDQALNTTDSVQFSELLLTPKSSSSGGEGTWFYDSDDNYIWIATE